MITFELFEKIPSSEIFQTGIVIDGPEGINMDNSGQLIRYVAKKGIVNDWALYVGPAHNSIENIRDYGNKVNDKHNIKNVIYCDDKVLKSYRH